MKLSRHVENVTYKLSAKKMSMEQNQSSRQNEAGIIHLDILEQIF